MKHRDPADEPAPPRESDDGATDEADEGSASEQPIRFREVSAALEFICWVFVALAPMLRLVNGPPVTNDQAAIQVAFVVTALSGAVVLRLYNWRVRPPE